VTLGAGFEHYREVTVKITYSATVLVDSGMRREESFRGAGNTSLFFIELDTAAGYDDENRP
jgi:hypothetical protein